MKLLLRKSWQSRGAKAALDRHNRIITGLNGAIFALMEISLFGLIRYSPKLHISHAQTIEMAVGQMQP
ncbi:MAG: hypothetical protein IPP77_13035 [Bacteroidetes bacterium]|nr:hypothetical protein [Bacteroidota bacterium]